MELLGSWIDATGEDVDPEGSLWEYDPTIDVTPYLGIDIGGSLIKLVCFSMKNECCNLKSQNSKYLKFNCPIINGRIHFTKFETTKINECLEFIGSNLLHNGDFSLLDTCANSVTTIKATGGGAFKFSDIFKRKLRISLDKVDEMDCLVAGANFLLKAVHNEAFTYMDDKKAYVQIDHDDLYPYLLVNIGSGVSMIKVEGDTKFERVSGTSVGGGTFWGLGKLLTKCDSFDELLMLSHQGNNKMVDMLVGDIYGGTDYTKFGLSSTTIASSFGKVVSDAKGLEEYRREDLSRSLLRMISNNIGQISYLNALRFGLKRIFFGGFFIRGQAYTMDTISVAVDYWSKGEAKAMFMRHEGFLGALGALMNYDQFKNNSFASSSSS